MSGKQLWEDLEDVLFDVYGYYPPFKELKVLSTSEEIYKTLKALQDKYNIKEELKCPTCNDNVHVTIVHEITPRNGCERSKVTCIACGTSSYWKANRVLAEQTFRDLFQRGD